MPASPGMDLAMSGATAWAALLGRLGHQASMSVALWGMSQGAQLQQALPEGVSHQALGAELALFDDGSALAPAGAGFTWTRRADVLPGCELALCVQDAGAGGIGATLWYDAAHYEAATAERLLRWWELQLASSLAQPGQPWDEVGLLDEDEQRALIEAMHRAGPVPALEADSVPALFEAQARRTPQAVALVHGARQLDYAGLQRHAQAAASMLVAQGVQPGDRVVIHAGRSIEMVVAVLAVLKAGAAYVPQDPDYPQERRMTALIDSAPRVVLADRLQDIAPLLERAGVQSTVLTLDRLMQAEAAEVALPQPSPASLAYVLYTSGSTGRPKGVAMPHGPLINLIHWQQRQPGLDVPQRTLQFAALGFDVAFQEIFTTLCGGGELHLPDEDARLSGARLLAFLADHRIERIFLPYFALQMLAEGYEAAAVDTLHALALKQVITAGEALRIEPRIRRLFQATGARLHNHYGPTETHVITALTLAPDAALWPMLPAIGTPIQRARVYVLDRQGRHVPNGVAGELFLAGPVLADGYLGRDDLTGERFVPDPFSNAPGARMYRSGDMGRWQADGTLECLGRADFQVKIRGHRVEPGEVEACLLGLPGVRQAAVVAREDVPGLRRLVAYVVADGAQGVVDALRGALAQQLPDYMLPSAFVRLQALPTSPNGKLERSALPAPARDRPDWAGPYAAPRDAREATLCALFGEVLGLDGLGRDDGFFELGGSSLLAMRLLQRIQFAGLGPLPPTAIFRSPTPAGLAAELDGSATAIPGHRLPRTQARNLREPIAIVGMAARLPGAPDVEAFWQNLCAGVDSITRFTPGQLDPSIAPALRDDPAYVPARGVLEGHDLFDAGFFGISPREAELMDPQQRIFLELCWEAIERAGHAPGPELGPVGVFAGMYNASYYQHNVLAHPDKVERAGAFQVMLGNEKDYLAVRVAHRLDLTGPAITVQTACSTSLVAVCQAVDSLRAGRCDMALAGGVAITCPVNSGHLYQPDAMLSPDGHTRSFDASAGGTVFSDGAAVLVLKRLADALADGDPIQAVIRGTGLNNDGAGKASFTAPSSEGQAAVIAMAHADAQVQAREIGYVEAHGTATPMGDPIEIEGLTRAFAASTSDLGFCRVGSVKSNIGHTLMAAGAAGLIKATLSVAEGRLPGTAHYRAPSAAIDFARTPFTVSAGTEAWPQADGAPRRAGVSSFGVGGTNAHVVIEQAPEQVASDPADGPQLLVLSARAPAALEQMAAALADALERQPGLNLADVAWTLADGRRAFPYRLAVAAQDTAGAVQALRVSKAAGTADDAARRPLVFMFPGQGAQYAGMGRALYAAEPAFREAFDACAQAAEAELGADLRTLAFGEDAQALVPTAVMQPAIFALEYALARWWMAQGLQPTAMVGHSVGEFVAATLAGVFALEDAMRLVALRGRLMQAQPAGSMLSVRMDAERLLPLLSQDLCLAAENAPGACVVAGPQPQVDALQAQLTEQGVACRPLRTSHAFHSAMMDPVVAPFRVALEAVARQAPTLPIVSSATGQWLDAQTAVSADYWARHLREPVRFASALSTLAESPQALLLEIGPRGTLCALARQHPAVRASGASAIASLSDAADHERTAVLGAFGQLWCAGVALHPARLDRRARRLRLRLPTYSFQRRRYWVEAPAAVQAAPAAGPMEAPVPAAPPQESFMSSAPAAVSPASRIPALSAQLRELFEDVAGFEIGVEEGDTHFMELGLDSLTLTQVALQLQKTFAARIGFRQLMAEQSSITKLAALLDAQLPAEVVQATPTAVAAPAAVLPVQAAPVALPQAGPLPVGDDLRALIQQQMQLMFQQLALLSGTPTPAPQPSPTPLQAPRPAAVSATTPVPPASTEEEAGPARYDVKKAFGAIARIDSTGGIALDTQQRAALDAFMARYQARTPGSKRYTGEHRPHMADPRVVTGFRPLTKEIVYQIVIERSRGSRVWDIDGNEYVDALNGFGASLFGWQPEFVTQAVLRQMELGYEIGPQHPLAGEVSRKVCQLTGHDRAALCNTGSEAVLGALRIARTVTGRSKVALFTGSYHGINDEVIVRATPKGKAVPAAPGILRNTAEQVLVLDYGTEDALRTLREHAHELAAVLVEPVQSRRPDFQPVEFLQQVRALTQSSGTVLIFDEVITGFRSHPGGAQALFGIQADLATYGKVVGGGFPIGVIAGKRDYMDALDGGRWQYGDDSVPEVGVTYFAGTFVRHPLTLAAANASLDHMIASGPQLQAGINALTTTMAEELNAFARDVGAPLQVRHFASLWRTYFEEDHPLQDLLFAMMRSRGIHILDNFPCFFTSAHTEADMRAIADAWKASVLELQDAGLLPRRVVARPTMPGLDMDAQRPPVPGARLGRDPDGRPGWYVPNEAEPGGYLKVGG